MKKTVLFFLVCIINLIQLFAQQQQITVKSFTVDENDLTANTDPHYDQNNQKCALIIVSNIGDGGFKFDAVNSYCKVESKDLKGQPVYLLWVSDGTRRLNISNDDPDIQSLQYNFNIPIKKAKTYYMTLGEILKSTRSSKQYLTFNISPVVSGLSLEVDDIPWSLSNGRSSNLVDAGQHTYRITAPEYNTVAGIIETQRTDGNKDVQITLIPEFGWLDIEGGNAMEDAEVFIDGPSIGIGNIRHHKLSHGSHIVKITKPHYKMYQANIIIKDGETVSLKPQFINDASDVTIIASNGAAIYIDGEYQGNGSWTGPLEKGQYIVESKLKNHRDVKQTISVPEIDKKYSFNLKANEPILTSLSVESNPVGSKIYIDGKQIGVTPYHINDIIIGEHNIVISKDGYNSYERTITLNESTNNKINATLDDNAKITIESVPSNAMIYVNNQYCGTGTYSHEYTKGTKLDIKIKSSGYSDFSTTLYANQSMTKKYVLNSVNSCTIDGTSGAYVKIDGKIVGRVPYKITGESGTKHKVEVYWNESRTKTKKKTITLGKDTTFYGYKEYHRNRGRQAANIIMTCLIPSLGWMSWLFNPVNE